MGHFLFAEAPGGSTYRMKRIREHHGDGEDVENEENDGDDEDFRNPRTKADPADGGAAARLVDVNATEDV